MPSETKLRSFAKALSHRIISMFINGGVIFALTQKATLAAGLALLDLVVKIVIYFLHERIWLFVPFGRTADVSAAPVRLGGEGGELTPVGERA
jgi:uncharacterized membrane protein